MFRRPWSWTFVRVQHHNRVELQDLVAVLSDMPTFGILAKQNFHHLKENGTVGLLTEAYHAQRIIVFKEQWVLLEKLKNFAKESGLYESQKKLWAIDNEKPPLNLFAAYLNYNGCGVLVPKTVRALYKHALDFCPS
ncbi:hypothetical protein P153DRAFT_100785 [Dothidotthia symphoricarpi CBS 119687]|uniref:Uncharacterized protein n=1 Tax=Dothidotthia symphoricarpi CBS 119687 TaxID=1392245 RepID=A0A6A6AQT8_9PLEO|nr:uncharacterized protein P153DRAFT_100785 [Dothidotthia symphoricarpi CBS 119687]KAF2133906.1 hypothetical protein P153DRAFT_100785 [Dothidotthia symphoricarpi CBS 119687]